MWLFIFLNISISIILYFVNITLGNIQFGGMDGGVLVNAGWQYHLGYKPYTDFITAVPPIFLILAKIAVDIFGSTWFSFIKLAAIFSFLTFFLQSSIFYAIGLGTFLSLSTSLFVQSSTILLTNHLWYNQLTSILTVIFLSSVALFLKKKNSYSILLFFLSLLVLLLGKPNVAGITIILVFLLMLVNKKYRILSTLIFILAALASILLLKLLNIDILVVCFNYLNSSNKVTIVPIILRNLWIGDHWEVIQSIHFSIPIILVSAHIFLYTYYKNTLVKTYIKNKELALIVVVSFIVSFVGMSTNNDYNLVDLPIFYSLLILFDFLLYKKIKNNIFKRIFIFMISISILVLVIQGLQISIKRTRIAAIGSGSFYEMPIILLNQYYPNNFFKYLRTGHNLLATIKNIDLSLEVIKKDKRNFKVFIGPRIDFAYAMFDIKPIKGLPLWWGEGSDSGGVPKGKTTIALNNLYKTKPLIGIFYDYTFLPSDLINFFENNYIKCIIGNLTVYYSKGLKISCEVN